MTVSLPAWCCLGAGFSLCCVPFTCGKAGVRGWPQGLRGSVGCPDRLHCEPPSQAAETCTSRSSDPRKVV